MWIRSLPLWMVPKKIMNFACLMHFYKTQKIYGPEFAFQDFRVLVSFSRFQKSGWLFQIAACSILIWPRSANALVGGAFDAIFKAALSTSTSLWNCFLFDRQIVDLRISEGVSRRKSISGFSQEYRSATVQR